MPLFAVANELTNRWSMLERACIIDRCGPTAVMLFRLGCTEGARTSCSDGQIETHKRDGFLMADHPTDAALQPDMFGFRDVDLPPAQRSRVTNDPTSRHRGTTADARRVKDLFLSYLGRLGHPVDAATQAAVFAAADLAVTAEKTRAKVLAGGDDRSALNELVRVQNMADRALRRLGLSTQSNTPRHVSLRERLARKAAAAAEEVA